jgi:hypothetical protein
MFKNAHDSRGRDSHDRSSSGYNAEKFVAGSLDYLKFLSRVTFALVSPSSSLIQVIKPT